MRDKQQNVSSLAIYGGTFDPPHNGHLNTAIAIQNYFHFERFLFLPCKVPVLKEAALATTEERLHMLQLALSDFKTFTIDPREIERETPSYMVDTLRSYREEWGEKLSITLCMGLDTFKQLHLWHEWQAIISLCHLLIMKRPSVDENTLPLPLKKLLSKQVKDKKLLLNSPSGKLFYFDAGQYPISSTALREQLIQGKDVSAYIPANVYSYIKKQALYRACPNE
jgi:nicotinate-nucleotide adenylyltransferase